MYERKGQWLSTETMCYLREALPSVWVHIELGAPLLSCMFRYIRQGEVSMETKRCKWCAQAIVNGTPHFTDQEFDLKQDKMVPIYYHLPCLRQEQWYRSHTNPDDGE